MTWDLPLCFSHKGTVGWAVRVPSLWGRKPAAPELMWVLFTQLMGCSEGAASTSSSASSIYVCYHVSIRVIKYKCNIHLAISKCRRDQVQTLLTFPVTSATIWARTSFFISTDLPLSTAHGFRAGLVASGSAAEGHSPALSHAVTRYLFPGSSAPVVLELLKMDGSWFAGGAPTQSHLFS